LKKNCIIDKLLIKKKMKKLIYIFFAVSVIFSACEKEITNGNISSNNTNGNSDGSFSVIIGVVADTYSPAELDITWKITEDVGSTTNLMIAEGTEASNFESYTLDSNSCYTVEMTSSGDGWGDYFLIVGSDDIDTIWFGQLESGSNGIDSFCSYHAFTNDIYGCMDPSAINYNFEATIDTGSCIYTTGSNDIYGCMDPSAINYNSEATIDDGSCIYTSGYEIIVTVTEGNSPSEISWDIYDPSSNEIIAAGGITNSQVICIDIANLGSLEFRMYDSFGDGWESATYTLFTSDNGTTSGTLEEGDYDVAYFNVTAGGDPCNK